jgi:alpha-beta hydrolase superfamily lysophospholipase
MAATVAAAVAGYMAYVAIQGSRALTRPAVRAFVPEEIDAPATPADIGIGYEEVRFEADDGVRLAGWLIPAARETRAIVILMHGFTGHRLPELAAFVPWLRQRYHVLQFDFRGHGDSQPSRVSMGLHERRDVAAAVRFCEEHGYGPIALLGISMGAAIGIIAAPDLPVAAVVADAAYADLRHPVANRMRELGYPLASVGSRLLLIGARLRSGAGLPSPIDCVGRIAPRGLLLIAPREDRLIRAEQSVRLYEAANEPKELFIVDGAGHGEAWATAGLAYEERVIGFLDRYLEPAATQDQSRSEAVGQRL